MKNPISQIRSGICNLMHGTPRSGHWPTVRKSWLKDNPACAACGSTTDIEVHHKRPFHLFPQLELDDTNFLTLCETMGTEHHLHVGHTVNGVSSWKIFNVNVVEDAAKMLRNLHAMKASLGSRKPASTWWETLLCINPMRKLVRPFPSTLPVMGTIGKVDIHYQAPTPIVKEYVVYGPSHLNVDNDGSGPSQGDPCHQSDTTLHKDGKPLNALIDKWVVVPKLIIQRTQGIVMGCLARITRISTGHMEWCTVGDEGPPDKIGEASEILVGKLGANPNPINGGDDAKDYIVEIWPGQAAPGYTLQAA